MTKKVIFNVILKKNLASLFSLPVQANVLVSGAVTHVQNQTLDCFAFKKILQSNKNNKSRLSLIARVNIVLNMTVVVDV